MKYTLIKARPSEVILENAGTEYEPGDFAALRDSFENIGGWVCPPIVYWDENDEKLHCLDGNHRLMVLRSQRGDDAVTMLKFSRPKGVSELETLEWRLKIRAHMNSKRRLMDTNEWGKIFQLARDKLGWTQEKMATEYLFDKADLKRIMDGKYEEQIRQTAESQKQAREKRRRGLR